MSAGGGPFYVIGGALGVEAASYVSRKADEDLFEALERGEFCYVLTPSQMGKTSLMARTAARLGAAGVHVVRIDLTAIGDNLGPEAWYYTLLMKVGRDLGLKDEVREYWRDHPDFGPMARWMGAIREVVLAARPGPVVIFIDEIGVVAKLPFAADEFFAAIRERGLRGAEEDGPGRPVFCLLGVATPSELLRDPRTTPFNIGRRIDLDDFRPEEARTLARGLGRDEKTAVRLMRRILDWTGGHPYLTQRLCSAVAEDPSIRGPAGVDRTCERLFLGHEARAQETNLREVERQALHRGPDPVGVLDLYGRVRRFRTVRIRDRRDPAVGALLLAGLARVIEGYLWVRNRIYYRVFDREWIRRQMPDLERRRRRAAFIQGAVIAGSVASVIIGFMVFLGDRARVQRLKAERNAAMARAALFEAHQARLQAERDAQRVEELLHQARDALDEYVSDINDDKSYEKVPRMFRPAMRSLALELALATALPRYEKFAAANPDVILVQSGLASTYYHVGVVQAQENRPKQQALQSFLKAVAHQRAVARRAPDDPQTWADLRKYLDTLAATARALARRRPDDPAALYQAARALGHCARPLGAGTPDLGDPHDERRRAVAEEAFRMLGQAVRAGYRDVAAIEAEPGFDPLRTRREFREFLARLRAAGPAPAAATADP